MIESREFTLLSGMTLLMQTCSQEQELLDVAQWYLPQLFSDMAGWICLSSCKEPVLAWGEETTPATEKCPVPEPDMPAISDPDAGNSRTVVVPFREGAEVFGSLCLVGYAGTPFSESLRGLALVTGEFLSLAISNVRMRNRLEEMSTRDPLTGLYNRRYMDDVLARELSRAIRSSASLGVVMVDLDFFKRINDTLGHDAGDHVLQTLARCLSRNVRSGDVVCRFGGEEFFILMAGEHDTDYVNRAEQLRCHIAALDIRWQDQPIGSVTASLGVAVLSGQDDTAQMILHRADQALYQAKSGGRNRVVMG